MRLLISAIIGVLTLFSQAALAHSEHDKARFVATDGVDQGRCNNRFRPCKSIGYAAQHANKGDKILLAAGQYPISDETELFYLVSQIVPVMGGYSQIDNYNIQNPDLYQTSVSGVPFEFAQQLSQQGFVVVRDTKTARSNNTLAAKMSGYSALKQQQSELSCVNNKAGEYSCDNVSLVAHVPLANLPGSPSAANDIWGHIDLNTGTEYALIGLNNGTAVVNLADPANPQMVGRVSGFSSIWRDIKVYQFYDHSNARWKAYAYVTTENPNDGLTIINLNNLPNSVSLVKHQFAFSSAHNIYISDVDYSLNIAAEEHQPLVHILGANTAAGAQQSFSLADPENLVATFTPSGVNQNDYTHDASSLQITDARKDSQCKNAGDSCLVILDFNEDSMRLWDQSNPQSRVSLSNTGYSQSAYVHSGWWSEDKNYVFVHDELDEIDYGLNSTLRIFDITDLTAPQLAGIWTGPTAAIDHNGFVRGNRYFMSNYERGLTILDISEPANPQQVGYFDTFPSSDNTSFNGAWGVYPFLPSGLIIVSDINSGLYILREHTSDNTQNSVAFNAAQYSGVENDLVTIEVTRPGDSAQALQVGYETLAGSADKNDFESQQGTLIWNAEDTSNKTINIQILADQDDDEFDEKLFVRLFNPTSGSTLTTPNLASIVIQGKAAIGAAAFSQSELVLYENQTDASVSVKRLRSTSEPLQITYTLVNQTAVSGEDIIETSGTLSWEANQSEDQSINLSLIDDDISEPEESILLVLDADQAEMLGTPKELLIRIRDDESNQPPIADAGADSQANARQSVTLQASASDPENDSLQIQWQQTAGTMVNLTGADTLTPSFSAPDKDDSLTFDVTVSDPFGSTAKDSVIVTVIKPATPPVNNTSSGGGGSLYWLIGLLLAMCICRIQFRYKPLSGWQ
ncbi:choice-of-anchor B family protein [Neptunicella sp. SCSIO 80796]|uniref:choice-of-anchor B family protein n=1 Tax=Neptunicella plasticusilytica TaxID=3117012 RepID=UPI003A4E41DF